MSEFLSTTGGSVVRITASIEEDQYLATFKTAQGVRLRWVAPTCQADVEVAFVDLAARNLELDAIVMHPYDLKIFNSTFVGREKVFVRQGEEG